MKWFVIIGKPNQYTKDGLDQFKLFTEKYSQKFSIGSNLSREVKVLDDHKFLHFGTR